MKQLLVFFTVLAFGLSNDVLGQSVKSNLRYINSQFSEFNKYESEFDVSGSSLVFKNKFSTSYIPFKDIDFRINYKHKSIDIYCIDGSKCINKGDMDWDYYNVSMLDSDGKMAKSIFETLEKCRQVRKEYVNREKYVSYGNSEKELLRYINRQFDRYNKYYSRFGVEDSKFVFSNKFGTAKLSFDDIYFKVNAGTKSVEFHCSDGSKCIQKYDFKGKLTTWDYYNVSLVEEGGSMSDVVYTVKEKCDKLKAMHSGGNNPVDDGEESIAGLLKYINSEFGKYNSYDARFEVRNGKFIFSNNMSSADPLDFNDIGFRINKGTKSVEIYCLDYSDCIRKGGSDWDYYNVSMLDGDEMASTAYTVYEKCKLLKKLAQGGGDEEDVVIDDNYDDNSVSGILKYVNRQFDRFNGYDAKLDVRSGKLIFSNNLSDADPLDFSDIGFRMNESTKSVEIYCLDNSKCIRKGGSDWDYYNISLVAPSGNMAKEAYTVFDLCKKMKRLALNNDGGSGDDNSGKKKKKTGSTDGTSGGASKKK